MVEAPSIFLGLERGTLLAPLAVLPALVPGVDRAGAAAPRFHGSFTWSARAVVILARVLPDRGVMHEHVT